MKVANNAIASAFKRFPAAVPTVETQWLAGFQLCGTPVKPEQNIGLITERNAIAAVTAAIPWPKLVTPPLRLIPRAAKDCCRLTTDCNQSSAAAGEAHMVTAARVEVSRRIKGHHHAGRERSFFSLLMTMKLDISRSAGTINAAAAPSRTVLLGIISPLSTASGEGRR
jgi:hypothetical protein